MWKDIEGWENFYEVSSEGLVRNKSTKANQESPAFTHGECQNIKEIHYIEVNKCQTTNCSA